MQRIPMPPGLRRLARRVRNGFRRKALILLYHRVARLAADPHGLCVSPEHLGEQLAVLRERARPVRLDELVRSLEGGAVPDRAVAVTFDDGYADMHHVAGPLLGRYQVPATLFVTTGGLGKNRWFWWDELERLVLHPGTLPGTLELAIAGRLWRWELGETACYTALDAARHRGWRLWAPGPVADPTPRHSLYRSLFQLLRPLPAKEREAVLESLRRFHAPAGATGEGDGGGAGDYRLLTPGEVTELARTGLLEIGGHTATHPVLAALPPAVQEQEILEGKTVLEAVTGRPVTSFAYPYGMQTDYNGETVAILRRAGFQQACAAFGGLVVQGADRFQLPRVWVPDMDGDTFARWLEGWFRG